MAKSSKSLDWCIVRLGEDHNWWVAEVSDPVRWDVDGLSIIDPRQVDYFTDLVEALRDYGFDQDIMDAAFIPFRIEKDMGNGSVRLKRVKDSIFESDQKLFALADTIDDENGPYADLLDHLTRCRVKMLNDLFSFESKLTVDEVEEELREEQNASFIEGRAIHTFEELSSILEYTPAGWDNDEERSAAKEDDEAADADLPELDEEEEEKLKNDQSLKWDEDEDEEAEDDDFGDGEKDDDDDEDSDEDDDEEDDGEEEEKKPKRRIRGKR